MESSSYLDRLKRRLGISSITSALGYLAAISVIVTFSISNRNYNADSPDTHSSTEPSRSTGASHQEDAANRPPGLLSDNSANLDAEDRLPHQSRSDAKPTVALYDLDYVEDLKNYAGGEDLAGLVSALLTIKLSQGDSFELLDRSMVGALFTEKSISSNNAALEFGAAALRKLPISEFSLTGSLFPSGSELHYSLKLVENSTGQVINAKLFSFNLTSVEESVQEALNTVNDWLTQARRIAEPLNSGARNHVSFGHFINIGSEYSRPGAGLGITERLIADFSERANHVVLSRTQTLSLAFEDYLHRLQYTSEYQAPSRPNSDFFIYGKYKENPTDTTGFPISIYLYHDLLKHGRDVQVIRAKNWNHAYELVNTAISNFLPDFTSDVDSVAAETSRRLFLDALRQVGVAMDKNLVEGAISPSYRNIEEFAAPRTSKESIAIRRLVDASLVVDPNNQFAKLALAAILWAERETTASIEVAESVLRSNDLGAADIALRYTLKKESLRDFIFRSFEDSEIDRDSAYASLIRAGYIKPKEGGNDVIQTVNADDLFFRTHALALEGVNQNEAVRIFEKIRALSYMPKTRISHYFHKKRIRQHHGNYSSWSQRISQYDHDSEAVANLNAATAEIGLYIVRNSSDDIPVLADRFESIESVDRQKVSLNAAIDGLSSAIFLDEEFINPKVLLGYVLCRERVGKCALGKSFHSWIVENYQSPGFGQNGPVAYLEKSKEMDGLIFLSANAIGRLNEAKTSSYFKSSLASEKYHSNDIKNNPKLSSNMGKDGVNRDQVEDTVSEFYDLLRSHCDQVEMRPHFLNNTDDYIRPMDSLTILASQSKKAEALRKSALSKLAQECPQVYPYFILQSSAESGSFVKREQDESIIELYSRGVIPLDPSKFERIALKRFKDRVSSGEYESAKHYISYFLGHKGATTDTALDFAYLYYLANEFETSEAILNGFKSFTITDSTDRFPGGEYTHSGFLENGHLEFVNLETNSVVTYMASDFHYGLGAMLRKWKLTTSGGQALFGNGSHRRVYDVLNFGGGNMESGTKVWRKSAGASLVGLDHVKRIQGDDGTVRIREVKPTSYSVSGSVEKTLTELFVDGYFVGSDGASAIKGDIRGDSVGPLLDSYFPFSLSGSRRIEVIKERLFENGFLEVSGVPRKYLNWSSLMNKVRNRFPDYTGGEQLSIAEALRTARYLSLAGHAKIYEAIDGAWKETATLIADDAKNNRKFGNAASIHLDNAFVCDAMDGLYIFKKIGGEWNQQRKINKTCRAVVVDGNWAVVGSENAVDVYKLSGGFWEEYQTIMRRGYPSFGWTLAVATDTIFVGIPHGGADLSGEVHIFDYTGSYWKKSTVISSSERGPNFSGALSATADLLVVADSTIDRSNNGVSDSGAVYLYEKNKNEWQYHSRILPAEPHLWFGQRVYIVGGTKKSILIKSREEVFVHNLP